ncbi:MAG: hypothetical protein WCG10_04560 [Chlamydiota bacterium]
MKTPAWYVFKDFLDLTADAQRQSLLRFLSDDLLEDFYQTPPLPLHPSLAMASYQECLHLIHYTWMIPFLDNLSDHDKYLFISPLNEDQKQSLLRHFDLSKPTHVLTPGGQAFVCEKLYQYLTQDYKVILPKECLPEDPLNKLLDLSREKLLHLVDLLSLHDLCLEIKSMISSLHLTKIENLLSVHQKAYLYELNQKIEPIAFKPMGLNHWNGDELLLKKLLHQRGLNRLSKALASSHLSLLWHLSHKLDIGRASIVKALFKQLKNKKAHTILVTQVCTLIDTL